MGLLDNIDPMSLLAGGVTMMANARGRNSRQAIPMGMDSFTQYQLLAQKQKQEEEDRKLRQQQLEQHKQLQDIQMAEYQRKIKQDERKQGGMDMIMEGLKGTPQFQGPWVDPNLAVQNVQDPSKIQQGMMMAMPEEIAKTAYDRMFPKPQEPIKLNKNERLIQGGKELIPAMASEEDLPSAVREYKFAQSQGYKGSFQDFQLEGKRAGAANVKTEIGFPKETFKNEKALRDEFNGLPHIKNYSEVKDAYAQIKSALASVSPAGDLTAATKFMKILDPGSVVRESELGMALQASGAMDRWSNYLQMYAKGERLTPTQRKDFGTIADKLYEASVDRYNKTAGQYRDLSNQYELNPDRVVKQITAETTKPTQQKSKSFDVDGKKVIGVLGADGNYYVTKNGKKYRVEE